MRGAVFRGELYHARFDDLNKQIEASFERGPGDLPINKRVNDIKGIIAPQGSYADYGAISAWAYKELGESKFPEFYIVLSDAGVGDKVYISLDDFETPLGIVKNIRLGFLNPNIVINEELHKRESGIEVQLPFLQYISKDHLNRLKIMPLLIGKECSYETIFEVAKLIKNLKRDFCVVCSSDFTKYGKMFNYTPFRYNVKGEVKNMDGAIIQLVENMESYNLWNLFNKFEPNISGKNSILMLLELLKDIRKEGKLLMYVNSGDVTGDYENFMNHASLVF